MRECYLVITWTPDETKFIGPFDTFAEAEEEAKQAVFPAAGVIGPIGFVEVDVDVD